MEKVINSYETMFIVDLDAGEAGIQATIDKFTGLIASNAELVEVTDWGKRRLAYLINDKPEGYYVIVTFKSEPSFPAELDRIFNIDENILRYMTLKLEFEAVKHEQPIVNEEATAVEETAEVAPAAEEVAAPAETAEETPDAE